MTKKDYVLIAGALSAAHKEADKQEAAPAAHAAIDYVTMLLAHELKDDNEAFSSSKFVRAADHRGSFDF